MDDQFHARFLGHAIAHLVHRFELPCRINNARAGTAAARVKRLARQVQHDRTVLADGVQHDRIVALGDNLAHDMNRFGF